MNNKYSPINPEAPMIDSNVTFLGLSAIVLILGGK